MIMTRFAASLLAVLGTDAVVSRELTNTFSELLVLSPECAEELKSIAPSKAADMNPNRVHRSAEVQYGGVISSVLNQKWTLSPLCRAQLLQSVSENTEKHNYAYYGYEYYAASDYGHDHNSLGENQAECPDKPKKPVCDKAEPQAPRDLTARATGMMTPKAATLNDAQAQVLPLANVHYHLGAEHKSDSYSNGTDSAAYDAKDIRITKSPRPGFMCSTKELTQKELAAYEFQHCKGNVEVGKSYEVHYVHSSAGYTDEDLDDGDIGLIDDGLGGAANGRGQLNPMIVVEAQVFQIVNGDAAPTYDDLLHGWSVVGHENAVMYPGSTTGQSHDNEVCSPYAITWHVDKACHKVSAISFDNLCKQMKDMYKLEEDLKPHGSRKIVDPKYVVKAEYVRPLA